MQKTLRPYILATAIFLSYSLISPSLAYAWKSKITSHNSTRQYPAKQPRSFEEQNKTAKDITGQLIPGTRNLIESIDRKNREDGFYERLKENKITGPEKVRNLFRRKK